MCAEYDELSGICNTCKENYYLSEETGKVNSCQPNPKDCKTASPQGICLQCNEKTEFLSGKCIQPIPNCSSYESATRCISCLNGYFSIGDRCLKLPPFCLAALADGSCIACQFTHALVGG